MDRRNAIILLATAAGIVPSDVVINARPVDGALPKVSLLIDMERFENFVVSYKGQTKTITPDEIMEAFK